MTSSPGCTTASRRSSLMTLTGTAPLLTTSEMTTGISEDQMTTQGAAQRLISTMTPESTVATWAATPAVATMHPARRRARSRTALPDCTADNVRLGNRRPHPNAHATPVSRPAQLHRYFPSLTIRHRKRSQASLPRTCSKSPRARAATMNFSACLVSMILGSYRADLRNFSSSAALYGR